MKFSDFDLLGTEGEKDFCLVCMSYKTQRNEVPCGKNAQTSKK